MALGNLCVALGNLGVAQRELSRHKLMPKELENHPKIHYSTRLGDLKIRCGAKDFRYGAKSR